MKIVRYAEKWAIEKADGRIVGPYMTEAIASLKLAELLASEPRPAPPNPPKFDVRDMEAAVTVMYRVQPPVYVKDGEVDVGFYYPARPDIFYRFKPDGTIYVEVAHGL